jgi:hypothetical protein
MESHRRARRAFAALVFAIGSWSGSATIIDRVLAVVDGRVITLSDVRGAVDLGLVSGGGADPVGAALERLIERELQLIEVDRYLPPEPRADAIDARVQAIRTRFAGDEAFAEALAINGLTGSRLRQIVRDDLRIQTYLDQRFAAAALPTDQEVADYYAEHAKEFERGGDIPPLASIEAAVRERLASERRRQLIAEWIAGLRRRSDVITLYLPG